MTLQVLTKEFYSIQATLDRRTTELEATINEKNIRLETYEKLEQELDDVVMQAAEGDTVQPPFSQYSRVSVIQISLLQSILLSKCLKKFANVYFIYNSHSVI